MMLYRGNVFMASLVVLLAAFALFTIGIVVGAAWRGPALVVAKPCPTPPELHAAPTGDQKYDVPYEPREAHRAYERKPDHTAPGQPAARNEKRVQDSLGVGAKESQKP